MAGNDETVAAVVAFSAKKDDVLAVPAVKPGTGPFGHGVAGIFHEDSRSHGIYAMHGDSVHIPHLSGSSNFLHNIFLLFVKGPDGPADCIPPVAGRLGIRCRCAASNSK